jgi:hypothetical protein
MVVDHKAQEALTHQVVAVARVQLVDLESQEHLASAALESHQQFLEHPQLMLVEVVVVLGVSQAALVEQVAAAAILQEINME